MRNSADIRKMNKNKIRRILWSGGGYTKQQIAGITGLSVATCNTLLNELLDAGEVIGEKARVAEVGRSTTRYEIDERFESILCLTFDMVNGQRKLTWWLLSMLGNITASNTINFDLLTIDTLKNQITDIFQSYQNISVTVVGTPSIAEHGIIRHCDIPELEGLALVDHLSNQFGIPVLMENDMHLKAFGFYMMQETSDSVVTLGNFPAHVLPGTASVHGGTILKGANQFAGMVGFLPYGIQRDEYLAQLNPKESLPLIEKAVIAIIALVNPEIIVFTGDLINQEKLHTIQENCQQHIPNEYIPRFQYQENMDHYYLEGMYQQALIQKGEIL
ncbi:MULTISPECIES: ROK family transcriptional regulator [Aerococcus]|uniref:ROK family transcriptional regulator n=1 Tax=Aerococcus TaxID=1375 RepID=UPI003B2247D9